MVVLGGILSYFYSSSGMENLARELRDIVEENNETDRGSENSVIRRRAENLDKMEEIYDRLLEDRKKKEG